MDLAELVKGSDNLKDFMQKVKDKKLKLKIRNINDLPIEILDLKSDYACIRLPCLPGIFKGEELLIHPYGANIGYGVVGHSLRIGK